MATRKKKVTKIKFELTKSGIGGIGVVCFCIFLWMFLLGVWAGQSLLLPTLPSESPALAVQQGGEKLVSIDDQKKKRPSEK